MSINRTVFAVMLCCATVVLGQPSSASQSKSRAAAKPQTASADTAAALSPSPSVAAEAAAAPAVDTASADSVVPAAGSLTVTTTPESAGVSIDGVQRGVTPLTVSDLAPGEHALELRKTGHYLKKARVVVAADSASTYAFELLKPARLVVISDPAGASVLLDGKVAGPAPYDNAKIKPGDHTVEVALDGYLPFRRNLSLGSGTADSLEVKLVKKQAPSAAAASREQGKAGKSLAARIIVLSVFVLFGIGIIIAELAGQ